MDRASHPVASLPTLAERRVACVAREMPLRQDGLGQPDLPDTFTCVMRNLLPRKLDAGNPHVQIERRTGASTGRCAPSDPTPVKRGRTTSWREGPLLESSFWRR